MKYTLLLILLFPLLAWGQEVTVSGKISDPSGESLPGVTIREKDTQNGTTSDFNGNFEVTVSSKDAILIFSFVGFTTKEVKVGDQNQINTSLKEDLKMLSGVEITGFVGVIGKARRRTENIQNTPESVTALNMEGIKNAGITDISSFSALVPNLKFNTSQAVGVNFITIRGIPQIRNGDAPVAFVIDGVTIPDPSLLNQELFD